MFNKEQKKKIIDTHNNYTVLENLNDKIFECDTFESIGNLIINSVLNEIDYIDYNMYKRIVENSFGLKKESEFEKDIVIQKLRLKYLPKDSLELSKIEYGKIMYRYNEICDDIDLLLGKLNKSVKQIQKEKGELKQKISKLKVSGENFIGQHKIMLKLINALELIYVEIDKISYSKSFIEKIIKELTIKKIKQISLEACKKQLGDNESENLIDRIKTRFEYYYEVINIIKKHVQERDYDLASVIFKSSKLYDDSIKSLMKESYKNKNLQVNEELIEDYKNKLDRFRELLSCKHINAQTIKNHIIENRIIEVIKKEISSIWCLKNKKIINNAIALFEAGEYEIFVNIILIQIEGVLDDIISGIDIFSEKKFTNLKDKVEILFFKETYEPYKYLNYDLNYMRNQVAHGNEGELYYLSLSDMINDNVLGIIYSEELVVRNYEETACLLILDLQAILFNTKDIIEEREIYEFVKTYFVSMGNKNISNEELRFVVEHDKCIKYLGWITNESYMIVHEFYDNIISEFKMSCVINKMKDIILDPIFWEDMLSLYSEDEKEFFCNKIKNIEKSISFVSKLKIKNYSEKIQKIYTLNSIYLKRKNQKKES